MSVLMLDNDHVEIFKFRTTGLLPLFDEVIEFINRDFYDYGYRWEAVDMRSDDDAFYIRLRLL